jgi:hypothetical protein
MPSPTPIAPERIDQVPVADLLPYARNARTHSDAQVAQIAASIAEFGFTNPCLVDAANELIAGHGRLLAARRMGLETVPCIRLGHLTPAQKRAYVIADNQLALNAGWDMDLLAQEIAALRVDDFDLELLGFDTPSLDEILAGIDGPAADPGADGRLSLAERFGVPPFSVLNAREGWWQDRKRAWLALGIQSELGRGGGLTMQAEQVTTEGLHFYRNREKQRQAAAPGRRATTVSGSAATAPAAL